MGYKGAKKLRTKRLGVMYQETKSAKTTAMMVGFGLVVAYVVTFVFYQIGQFIF